jgi:hypothetical protein
MDVTRDVCELSGVGLLRLKILISCSDSKPNKLLILIPSSAFIAKSAPFNGQ